MLSRGYRAILVIRGTEREEVRAKGAGPRGSGEGERLAIDRRGSLGLCHRSYLMEDLVHLRPPHPGPSTTFYGLRPDSGPEFQAVGDVDKFRIFG